MGYKGYSNEVVEMVDRFGVVGGVRNIAQYALRCYYEWNLVRKVLEGVHAGNSLDFGCGYGRLTCVISEFSRYVVGIDIDFERVKMASESYRDWGDVDFVVYRGLSLPFRDGCFDLIVSFTVLQHVDDGRCHKYINEFRRLSRKFVLLVEETERKDAVYRRSVVEYGSMLSPEFRLIRKLPRYLGCTFKDRFGGDAMLFARE